MWKIIALGVYSLVFLISLGLGTYFARTNWKNSYSIVIALYLMTGASAIAIYGLSI